MIQVNSDSDSLSQREPPAKGSMWAKILPLAAAAAALVATALVFTYAFLYNETPIPEYEDTFLLTVGELGTLKGRHIGGTVQFYGVPYAEQPERFQHAPGMPPAWETPFRPAYEPENSAPICYQHCYGANDIAPGCNHGAGASEQCLYMQITVPERLVLDPENTEKLAVFVYLHGGAFDFGSGHVPLYEGRSLAAQGDIIAIGVNYRLNIFGFMPWNSTYQGQSSYGNFGLTDQQRALEFVNKYIHYFGGDNTRVTLGGQSAGSESTLFNLLHQDSPHQDWFQQAYMMSVPSLPYLTQEQAEKNMVPAIMETAYNIHCVADNICCDTQNFDCLLELETEQLYHVAKEADNHFFDFDAVDRISQLLSLAQMYDPIVDGNIVKGQTVAEATRILTQDKPVMVGSTGDEGELFIRSALPGSMQPLTQELYEILILPLFWVIPGTPKYRRMLNIYPYNLDCERFHDPSLNTSSGGCDAIDGANHAIRDFLFTCSQRKFLMDGIKNEVSATGANKNNFYLFYFDEPFPWTPPELGGGYRRCGTTCPAGKDCGAQYGMACHGVDIGACWQADKLMPFLRVTPGEAAVYRAYGKYVTNFVRNGDPNNNGNIAQNQYTEILTNFPADVWEPLDLDNWGYMRYSQDYYGDNLWGGGYEKKPVLKLRNIDKSYSDRTFDHTTACDEWDDLDFYNQG